MPTSRTIMDTRTASYFRSSKMLLAELVVIFLGVYSAFWVDNYRDEQDRKERTAQVILALQQDLTDNIEVSDTFSSHIRKGLRDWSSARDRGESAPPFVFRIYGAERPPLTTWEAVRQAQLAELLQSNLLYELGFFYNELAGIGDRLARYGEFTESEVLPRLKTGSAGFYTEDGSQLLPRFEAHMDRLRENHRLMDDMSLWATCLLRRLESVPVSTTVCRTDVGVTVIQ